MADLSPLFNAIEKFLKPLSVGRKGANHLNLTERVDQWRLNEGEEIDL